MEKFEKEIHSITKKVNDVYGSIFQHFENKIAQLQNEIESLKEKQSVHDTEIENLNEKHQTCVESMEEKYNLLQEKYNDLNEDYTNYKKVSMVKALNDELNQAKNEIELLKKTVEKLKTINDNEEITLEITNKVEDDNTEELVEDEEVVEDDVVEDEEVEEDEEVVEDEEVGDEEVVEEEEEVNESEEEVEFIEKKIRKKMYYVTDDEDREIYEKLPDGEIGDKVGQYINNRAKFFKK